MVARTRAGRFPLFDAQRARWLSRHLREAFPDVLSAMLMPNHVHLLPRRGPGHRRTLSAVLGAFARTFELGELWLPVPEPEPLGSADKLARAVRYVGLNPCRPWTYRGRRVQLAGDPLEWMWSTTRDLVGAVIDPWCSAHEIADVLGWAGTDPARALHRYISSDPCVAVEGSGFPEPPLPSKSPSASLSNIARAALAATRGAEADLRSRGVARTTFAGLARRQGYRDSAQVATWCGVHPDTVPRLARACPTRDLAAAAACLGDRRLLAGPGKPRPLGHTTLAGAS